MKGNVAVERLLEELNVIEYDLKNHAVTKFLDETLFRIHILEL